MATKCHKNEAIVQQSIVKRPCRQSRHTDWARGVSIRARGRQSGKGVQTGGWGACFAYYLRGIES